jgi:DNA ligase 1
MIHINMHQFPPLYGIEKNGKEKVWIAVVTQGDKKAISTITYGQVDGKQQVVVREYDTGKNIGRANETTPYQQCFNETERKWKDKKEKENYSEMKPDSEQDHNKAQDTKILPMLAVTYSTTSTKRNDIVYPCMIQPKLDGLRCIMYMKDGVVKAQSRTGGYFESLSYLTDASRELFHNHPDLILDGELYTMDIPFETLAGLIKKKHLSHDDTSALERYVKYHVYDLVSDQPFHERLEKLNRLSFPSYIIQVLTITIPTMDEFRHYFSTFVEQGYEGIMLRNINGLYQQGYRSHHLQKYKEFCEEEYPIIGYEDGDGRDKGCVIWICNTKEGKEFRVRPRGTMEQRKVWFQQGKSFIGKMLTVIYQELSEQNVPRFPVGKAIRDGY